MREDSISPSSIPNTYKSVSVDSVKSWPDFRFETLPDGLPPEHGRTSNLAELCRSFTDSGPLHFDKLKHSQPDVPPVTCIISDGAVSFSQKTARKLAVPRVAFWTHSACGFCAYFFGHLLVSRGLIPGKDDARCLTNGCMEQIITCITGMPPLRVKDLPTSLRHKDMKEFVTSRLWKPIWLRFVGGGTGLYIGATWRTSLLIAIKDIKQATSNQTMQNLGFQFQAYLKISTKSKFTTYPQIRITKRFEVKLKEKIMEDLVGISYLRYERDVWRI